MDKICGIYKITSPSDKIYIGQSKDITKRYKTYRKYNEPKQRRLYYSVLKYGWENHKFEIIEECSIELLNKRERYWQDYYDVLNKEKGLNCNLTNTKQLPRIVSLETKKQVAKTSLEDCLIIWDLYISGKTTSEIQKIFSTVDSKVLWKIKSGTHWVNEYLSNQGILYDDYKHLIKTYNLSKKDEEDILNLYYKDGLTVKEIIKIYNSSTKVIGNILKITKRRRKSKVILQYDLNNNFIKEWISSKEIENHLGFNKSNINHAATSKYKNYKGFIWKYKP